MPPKKDNKDPNEDGETKKKRKYKTRKKKKECPSRIRKTDRVVIHKQARDMIAKVYEFMKREAVKEYAEKLTNARWRTATAVGVSEKTVSRILKERAKKATTANAVGTVIDGKVAAANDLGVAAQSAIAGDVAGAAGGVGKAISDVVTGDVSGAKQISDGFIGAAGGAFGTGLATASNIAGATSQAAGEVIGAKLNAAQALGGAAITAATGNIPLAVQQTHDAFDNLGSAELNAAGILANAAIGNGRWFF